MAYYALSRMIAPAKSSMDGAFTDVLVRQYTCTSALPRQAPCAGILRRLAIFGSPEQTLRMDSGSQIRKRQESEAPVSNTKSNPASPRGASARELGSTLLEIWDPFKGNSSLRLNAVDCLFDDGFLNLPSDGTDALDCGTSLDMMEYDDGFEFYLTMPALGEYDVKVSAEDTDLVIKRVLKACESKKDTGEDSWPQYIDGNFRRWRLRLPENVDVEKMVVLIMYGVLFIYVPKIKPAPKNNVTDINVE